jgi:VWFA-related protein
MPRLLPTAALGLALVATQPPAAPTLRVDLVATTSDGRPVDGLAADDLEVRIGAYRLPVESLRHVTPGDDDASRHLVLLLDDVTLPAQEAPRVREIAKRLVDRMAPADRMSIATFNGELMEATGERARLMQRLDRYNGLTAGVITVDRVGRYFLELLTQLCRRVPEGTPRPIVVALGAGWVFDTPIPPPDVGPPVREEWTGALRAMAQAHATLYVIDPVGVGPRAASRRDGGFARETGGLAYINTNDFAGAVEQVMRDAVDYYAIRLADPPIGRMADLRPLEVTSRRRDVTLRARRWLTGRPGE